MDEDIHFSAGSDFWPLLDYAVLLQAQDKFLV